MPSELRPYILSALIALGCFLIARTILRAIDRTRTDSAAFALSILLITVIGAGVAAVITVQLDDSSIQSIQPSPPPEEPEWLLFEDLHRPNHQITIRSDNQPGASAYLNNPARYRRIPIDPELLQRLKDRHEQRSLGNSTPQNSR